LYEPFFKRAIKNFIYFLSKERYNTGMKVFLTALVLLFIIKGITYVLFPQVVQRWAQKMIDVSVIQLRLFGWILILVFTGFWLGLIRYIP